MADSSRPKRAAGPSLQEALALPRTLEARVEPRFIDSMGHMNVAWYVHLFDLATWALFAQLGIDDEYRRRAHTGMFAVEEHIRYLGELREGDPLEVRSRLLEVAPKSLRILHVMTDPVRARVSATAEVVGVHIDLGTRRSTPLPPDVAARAGAALVATAPPPAAATDPTPLTESAARALADEWIAAWNAHDLERILAPYADDVVLTSPVAADRLGDPGGTVRGRAALRAYFAGGLTAYPDLRFELRDLMWGVRSLVLYYANQRGTMTGEFMELDDAGKVARVVANYSVGRA